MLHFRARAILVQTPHFRAGNQESLEQLGTALPNKCKKCGPANSFLAMTHRRIGCCKCLCHGHKQIPPKRCGCAVGLSVTDSASLQSAFETRQQLTSKSCTSQEIRNAEDPMQFTFLVTRAKVTKFLQNNTRTN